MITLCFVYFRSLALANLAAALYSVRKQDLSAVKELIVVDNNTEDSRENIQRVIEALEFPIAWRLLSFKHGDLARTHSWSTNVAVRQAVTTWVLFTRADYLLDFELVKKFSDVVALRDLDWNGFVTSNGYQLNEDIGVCNQTSWRDSGLSALRRLPGVEIDYTCIDSGVWMARWKAFDRVGGLDTGLTAWGHAQTHFQYKLYKSGVEFVRVPEVLYYHPIHSAERNIDIAHQQLRELGVDLKEMWARYEGQKVY